MVYSPTSEWILMGISKDKDRLVFMLNKVVNRFYDISLKRQRFFILVVQTKINEGKEEIRIVRYLSLRLIIIYMLDEAKRNKQSLRCSFIFISYKKDRRYKEVFKAIKNHVLIDGIFILIQLCNIYLFPYNRLSLITKCLKIKMEFKALLIRISGAIRLSERII